MYGYIYLTTNLINNKKYIGKRVIPDKYKNDLKSDPYLGSGKNLKKAIKKYGEENFSKEILFMCSTSSELSSMERYYIKIYDAVKSKNFYNIHEGGDGGNTILGYTDEEFASYKKRLSQAMKNSEKFKQAMQSEEYRKAQSDRAKKRCQDNEYISKLSIGAKRSWNDERKEKHIEYVKNQFQNNEFKEKWLMGINRAWDNEERRKYISEIQTKDYIVINTITNEVYDFHGRESICNFLNRSLSYVKKRLDKNILANDIYLIKRKTE